MCIKNKDVILQLYFGKVDKRSKKFFHLPKVTCIVEAGKKLFVHRLAADQGAAVEFDKVLLIDNDGDVKVGTPLVEGAKVVCEVLSHLKGERIIVFKKKRRKGYRKRNGHRQAFTEVLVKEIVA